MRRSRRVMLATVATAAWLLYMVVGLAVINVVFPTIGGEGPRGTAGFIGMVAGLFTVGAIMWAASD